MRDVTRNPLFQLAFNLVDASGVLLESAGVTFGPLRGLSHVSRFDIEVHVAETATTFIVDFLYRTELFERDTIERLLSQFVRLLEGMIAAPETRVDALPLVSAGERGALVAAGTGPAGGAPAGATIAGMLAAQMAARPGAVALEAGGATWTYAALGAAAGQVAGALRAAGVGPNVPVGIWLPREAGLLITVAGIVGAGGGYVALEPTQPRARAARMWGETGVRVVVTDAAAVAAGTVPAGPWTVLPLESVLASRDARRAEAGGREAPLPLASTPAPSVAPILPDSAAWGGGVTAGDLAYVVYTSGSTGTPKGVAVPQRAVVRLVAAPDYVTLGPATVMGQAATVAFDAATFEIWGAWLHGGRLVVLPGPVVVSPPALGAAVRAAGVTTLFLTTALVHQIGREAPGALAGLDTLLFGGEAVEPRWVAALQTAGGPRRIVHVYGPTEVTTFATAYPVAVVPAGATTLPIGGAIVDTQAYVLDAGGAVVPVGVPGELYSAGAGSRTGMWARRGGRRRGSCRMG